MTTDRRPAAQAFLATALLALVWLVGQGGALRFDPCGGCFGQAVRQLMPAERVRPQDPCPLCRTPGWNGAAGRVVMPLETALLRSCPGCYD